MLDRALISLAPQWAARRLRARYQISALTGGYMGARKDRRATSQWSVSAGSADADTLPDLPLLRERSRDLVRNDALAGGAINTVVTNVVGGGLKLQPEIDREVLGLGQDAADAWQREVERLWRLWAESEECDLTRSQRFADLQDTAFRAVLESGDVFVPLRFQERAGSPFGLKLQLIEADRVSNPGYRADGARLRNGRRVYGGVEVDRGGAPVAYWILERHPGALMPGARTWRRLRVFGRDSGRRNVLHLYRRLRPELSRGVPYLASVIEPLKQLSRYSEAEVMAAVVGAMFTVFVKSESDEGLAPFQPDAETGGKRTDDDYKLGNGAILSLRQGEDIKVAEPGRPNQAFDPFVTAILRQIGVNLELPFEVLVKHFQSSYSAARAALLEAWRFFRARRAWLAARLCQPAYEALVTEAVARGLIEAPGFFDDPMLRRAWLGAEWIGPAQGQIDPFKENKADELAEARGWKTASEITAEKTGGDWERKHEQRVREHRRRLADGLEGGSAGDDAEADDDPDAGDRVEQQGSRGDALPAVR